MNDCMFYFKEGYCKALYRQECEGCTFKKTEQQYIDGQKHAEELLAAKGLRSCIRHCSDGTKCVSVERIVRR